MSTALESRTIQKRIKLHKTQSDFIRCPALYKAYTGGVGSGKSWAGSYDLIRRSKPGRLYMVVAPTYKTLYDATSRSFKEVANQLGVLKSFRESRMEADLTNGATVIFRSCDNPDGLRGPNASGAWIDEAAETDKETPNVIAGRLREGGELGFMIATFTPKGRMHWTFSFYGPGNKNEAVLFISPTHRNPFLPPGFYDRLKTQYGSKRAAQELEGKFVTIEGAEFDECWFGDDIWFDQWPTANNMALRFIACDPSKGRDAKSGDYTAIVSVAFDTMGKLWCEATMERMGTGIIADAYAESAYEFQKQTHGLLDGAGLESNMFQELLGAPIKSSMLNRNIYSPVIPITNTVNKQVRIRRLAQYLSTKSIKFRKTPGTQLLVEQLMEFPEGEHDDGPDALEMTIRLPSVILDNRK